MKELGEIAEVLIKKNRSEHWKNELGDLCGLCIKPMLDLAQMIKLKDLNNLFGSS